MLRIGILLDSYTTSAWIAKIVEDIQSSNFAQVVLVVRNTPPPADRPSLRKRLRNHWKLTLYNRYETWDYRRHRAEPDAKAPRDLTALLDGIPCLTVVPMRKGFTDRLSDTDIAQIAAAELDVLFRFGFRILRGPILSSARYGVWSFHHDDNLEYRGGPPLFWEISEGNPISGTILQILNETLDSGRVIYRAHSSTNLTSLYRSRNPIYWKTAEFAMRRLRDLHQHGFDYLKSLPTYTERDTYDRGIYRTPNTPQMLSFLARLLWRRIHASFSSRWRGGHVQWFLALRKRSPGNAFDDPSGYHLVLPPNDRFYADPCLFEHNDTTFLFFEDYRYSDSRALISCAELDAEGHPGKPFEVLRRPYHLSYPFLFRYEGEIYMIPETRENRTVELYRATDFPHAWTLDTVLLENVHAVDATVHQQDGKLWIFAGLSNGAYSTSDELAIFYADHLRGPWTPHPANPVLSDVRRSRPAGALFVDKGRLIRPSQNCGPSYGYGLVFSEVLTLTTTEFSERHLGKIDPDWQPRNLGTHTFTRSSRFEAIDGSFPQKISAQ